MSEADADKDRRWRISTGLNLELVTAEIEVEKRRECPTHRLECERGVAGVATALVLRAERSAEGLGGNGALCARISEGAGVSPVRG